MPEMIPVGNTTNPPNAQQTLGSLSGLLGIQQQQVGLQQQRQALQTGQYTQATAQANSQQDQQRNAELQAAQTLAIQGAKSGKYTLPDGTLDRQKMADDITTVAPTYGQPIANNLLSQANEVVQNQQAHQNLSATQQQQMGNTFLGLAGKQDLTNSDVIDAVGNLRSNNRDPQFNRMLDSMLTHLPQSAPPGGLNKIMASWGAASTGQSQVEPGTVNTGGAILPSVSNKFTGATAIGGGGPGVRTSLTPGEQLPHQVVTPSGVVNVSPGGTLSAPPQAGAAPSAIGLNPTTAQAQTQQGMAAGITNRIQQAKAQDFDRPTIIDALQRARAILAAPDAPALGSSFELNTYLKNALSSMNVDTKGATDANELVKNLARAEAGRAQGSPIGTTDAGRSLLSKGTGSTHIDNAAALSIVDQSLATEMAGRGYLKAVGPHQANPDQMQAAESKFLSTPHLIQAYELGLKKNPNEVESFLRQYGLSKSDVSSAASQLKAQGAM